MFLRRFCVCGVFVFDLWRFCVFVEVVCVCGAFVYVFRVFVFYLW